MNVSGITGPVLKISVTFSNLSHTQPDDLDILLVSPNGRAVMLMSDAGGINALNSLTLTIDDSASQSFPDSGQIFSGSYKPSDYQPTDILPPPAPDRPYGTNLSAFYPEPVNGVWQLFVDDDTPSFSGSMAGGWTLNITSIEPACCIDKGSADLVVNTGAAPDPVVVGNYLTNTITVSNAGRATATGVTLTSPFPAQSTFVLETASQGTVTTNSNGVLASVGS